MIPPHQHLGRLRPGVRRGRASTWDRSGGNDDFISLAPGETAVLAEADGPGQITHLWCTLLSPDLWWGRSLALRAYWDGEATPSVEAPLGDLFGSGNCLTAMYSSALVEAAPRDGLSLHCWAPMPYADGFRITVTNDGPLPVLALYAYVDYERWPRPDPELARFHAWWHRERRAHPVPAEGTYAPGVNLSGADNYLLLDTSGRGHYVGACLYVQSEDGGWYGEGDDMIFVDGEGWPPSVHGTGTEDYLGTAWSPATAF
ncbi:MAG: glycoside hydrolase family 172 protein, partial [Mycobacteriales bacterium]